jgi:peptidoglycan/LPS O-acetylase OafA/YrhL
MTAVVTDRAVLGNPIEGRPKRAVHHIPSLDGLRAISFLIVFVAHAGVDAFPGGFGVTVFFFLSGYLITTLMRVEAERTGRVSLGQFYLRRALRILPPFYIVLITATALGSIGFLRASVRPQPGPVLAQALHVSNYWIASHGWDGLATGTGVYWSLAVEEHFYFLFPGLFIILSKLGLDGRQKAFVFWGMCAAVLVWRCVLVLALNSNVDRTYLCSDTRVDSILFGCALAVWNNPVLDDVRAGGGVAGGRGEGALVLGFALLLVGFVVRSPLFRETVRYTIQGIGLTPIFVAAVRYPQWWLFRPLNWRLPRWIGLVSYSLYLVHQITIAVVTQHTSLPRFLQAVAAMAIAVALAWTMYRLVEKPCARLRKRLSAVE